VTKRPFQAAAAQKKKLWEVPLGCGIYLAPGLAAAVISSHFLLLRDHESDSTA